MLSAVTVRIKSSAWPKTTTVYFVPAATKSPDPSVPHALYGTADLRFTVPDCGNRSREQVTNAGALNER